MKIDLDLIEYPAIACDNSRDLLAFMGHKKFAAELGTTGFTVRRQAGKTSAIAELAQAGDIVIHASEKMKQYATKNLSYRHGTINYTANIESISKMLRGIRPARTEWFTIWFDEVDAVNFERLRDFFISALILPCDIDLTKVRFVFFRT